MKQWFIGFNDYWYTGTIYLEKVPWHMVAVENLVMYICDTINRLDIPIPRKWRKDYGNLGGVFHVFVCMKITDFVSKKTESKSISLPFFFLEEEFPYENLKDDVYDGEFDKQRKKNKKSAKKLDKRFRRAYNKVLEHENLIFKERRRT